MLQTRDPTVERAAARVDAGAKAFASAISLWMRRVALVEARAAGALYGLVTIEKADSEAEMRREFAELIRRFGVRQAADAARGVAGGVIQPERLVADVLAGKPTKIKVFTELAGWAERAASRITQQTRIEVRDAVRGIVADGRQEGASAGEIARRIRTQLHGPDPVDRIYAFSPERAALIARTELVQAENMGIVAGYEATGVEWIEWLAYRDGRSGDRHHERMHGTRVRVGEYFTLPSGAKLRYPGDPDGPIGEVANCRCTTRPVRAAKPDTTPGSPPAPATPAAPPPPPRPEAGTWAADPGLSSWAPREYSDPRNAGSAPTGNFDEAELARAAASVPPSGAMRHDDQLALRRQLREAIARYGVVSTDIAREGGADARRLDVNNPMPIRDSLAYHDWSGRVALGKDATAGLAAFGRGDRSPEAQLGMHTAIHEEVHGHGPAKSTSYRGYGRWVEEATTEIAARQVYREQAHPGARLSPTDAGPIARLSDGSRTYVGAYQHVISPIWDAVRAVLGANLRADQINDALERSALRYRRLDVTITTKEQALDHFVDALLADDAFKGAHPSTRGLLRDMLKRRLEVIR